MIKLNYVEHREEPQSLELWLDNEEIADLLLDQWYMSDHITDFDRWSAITEQMVANSDLEHVGPEDIGALTSDPYLIARVTRDDQGEVVQVHDLYHYDRYALESVPDLLLAGRHFFLERVPED